MKNRQFEICVLFFTVMIAFYSCQDDKRKLIIRYGNGKPYKIIYTYKDVPSYSFIETYDSTGVCVEQAEYQNSFLNGKRFVYNPLTGSALEQYYVLGKKHGIERMAVRENSHERLYINDTVVVLKVFGFRSDERDSNKVVRGLYQIVRYKGGRIIGDDGQIVLKGNSFVSIYDLNREDIDMSRTLWHFDNLADTVPCGSDVEFDVELAVFDANASKKQYLFGEIVLYDFNSNFEMLSNSKYKYKSAKGQTILKGKINIPQVGYKLVTGIIEQTYLDELKRDTVYTYQIFYKQVYVKKR
jgi:hypothetical protein